MKKYLWLFLTALCSYIFYFFSLPPSTPYTPPPLPVQEQLLLVPLDSRPPCTLIAQDLGRLASIDVILPPKELLDNYRTPANREKLSLWLSHNAGNCPAVISGDLLIHGGLLASRLPQGTVNDEQNFFKLLQAMPSGEDITVFSIIPRLLVSDNLLPDAWYQWHLMRYSTLRDIVEQFGDYPSTAQLEEIKNKIPQEILQKYNVLYSANDSFNKQLAALCAAKNYTLVIGQDDAQPFGLPNRNRTHAEAYMRRAGLSRASTTTCGADEIAQMLTARRFCQINNYKPKFYIEYTTGSAATAIMPYMAVTAEAALLDKIKFTGGTLTQNLNEADVILYVHCGSAEEPANEKIAQKLQTLLNSGKHVAVIDASEDYESSQMLLPVLLANNVTINKLVSYSAWNTFGNAAGTSMAQSAIFTGQLKRLPKHLLPALYAQNLNFTVARLLDDYSYQKLLHHRLSTILTLRGQDPANLNGSYKTFAENIIEGFIYNEKRSLLYTNLGLTPFYSDGADKYYLTGINAETKLPWNRIFEIELKTNCEYGIKKSAQ